MFKAHWVTTKRKTAVKNNQPNNARGNNHRPPQTTHRNYRHQTTQTRPIRTIHRPVRSSPQYQSGETNNETHHQSGGTQQ
jgi:hypothetical protein